MTFEARLRAPSRYLLPDNHHKSLWGNVKIVQVLLDNGADVNIQDEGGQSPIEVLSSSGRRPLEIMQMLLDRGANLGSALQIASYRGIEEFVNILLDHGADINARFYSYSIRGDALQLASLAGHEKTVRLLLQRGANITSRGGYLVMHPVLYTFSTT